MRLRIQAETETDSARAGQLLRFSLARVSSDIADVCVRIEGVRDPLGTRLIRCSVKILMRHGDRVQVEETQANLELAVVRALERSIRTIQRRLRKESRRLSA